MRAAEARAKRPGLLRFEGVPSPCFSQARSPTGSAHAADRRPDAPDRRAPAHRRREPHLARGREGGLRRPQRRRARRRSSAPSPARSRRTPGSISLPKGARIGRVEQEAPSGPQTLIETVLAADRERAALLDEAEHATDPHRIAELHTRLADIDAHSAEARAARILAGLGFDAAGAGAALLGFFRRLADARGARGAALRRARPPAPRRADQLPRPRRHAVARALSSRATRAR